MAAVRKAMRSVVSNIAESPSLWNEFLSEVKISDPNLARTYAYAVKYQALDKKYRFELIGDHHMPHLMDLSKGFLEDESITQATGCTIDNCRRAMEYVLTYAIAAQPILNLGYICYDNATNKPVGMRLVHPYYRDASKKPFDCPPEPIFGPHETSLFTPLDEGFDKVWNHYPKDDVIVKGEIVYIDRAFRRGDGLFHVLVDYGMDFPTMAKQSGANYYVVACTSQVTKNNFASQGYDNVYSVSPYVKDASGKEVKLPQGEIHMVTTNMNTSRAINVKPVWEKMKELGIMEK